MKTFTFIICAFISLNICANEWNDLLDTLDVEVAKSSYYVEKKEAYIARLKENLSVASFIPDRYLSSRQLYLAYCKFDPDSAEHYSRKCFDYGLLSGNIAWQQEASLDLAYLYTLRCDFFPANSLLKKVGPIENIPQLLQERYARIKIEEAMRISMVSTMQTYKDSLSRDLWQKYSPYLSANSHTIYETQLQLANVDSATKQKLHDLTLQYPLDTYERATLEFALYLHTLQEGKSRQAFAHLIRSAIVDIRLANREAQSILAILRIINNEDGNDEQQLERLYNYTLLCTDNIRIYKDIGRSIKLMEAQKQIQKSYKKLVERKRDNGRNIVSISALLFLLMLLAYGRLWRKRKKQSVEYQQLHEVNALLVQQATQNTQNIGQLQQQIENLENDIQVRDKAYSKHLMFNVETISQMKQFKKKVLNQLVAGRLTEAKKLVSESIVDECYTNSLYAQFDAIFLSIYPDFVARFNELLRTECHITLDKPSTLTPELRIYALVCLGVADSVSIAEYLQYSTQTIYNYRLKMRHASAIPEKNFAEAVAHLYR